MKGAPWMQPSDRAGRFLLQIVWWVSLEVDEHEKFQGSRNSVELLSEYNFVCSLVEFILPTEKSWIGKFTIHKMEDITVLPTGAMRTPLFWVKDSD